MFCINCSHNSTNVTNSRPSKKLPTTWRRRKCPKCLYIFSTDEHPRYTDIAVTDTRGGATNQFNPGIMTISIASSFQHDQARGRTAAWDLMETVTMKLFAVTAEPITTDLLARLAYETIYAYDQVAGAQYGLTHHMITASKRRGRPSLGASAASRGREMPR